MGYVVRDIADLGHQRGDSVEHRVEGARLLVESAIRPVDRHTALHVAVDDCLYRAAHRHDPPPDDDPESDHSGNDDQHDRAEAEQIDSGALAVVVVEGLGLRDHGEDQPVADRTDERAPDGKPLQAQRAIDRRETLGQGPPQTDIAGKRAAIGGGQQQAEIAGVAFAGQGFDLVGQFGGTAMAAHGRELAADAGDATVDEPLDRVLGRMVDGKPGQPGGRAERQQEGGGQGAERSQPLHPGSR